MSDLKKLQALAESGDTAALFCLGMKYLFGYKTDRDAVGAIGIEHIKTCVERGHAPAKEALATIYKSGIKSDSGNVILAPDLLSAVTLFEECANEGSGSAQIALAHISSDTDDYEAAARWFMAAAEQGYYIAQSRLAMLYEAGLGVEQNNELAHYWNSRADERDF